MIDGSAVHAQPEPTLGELLRSIAYRRLPAQFYQLLQLAIPLAFQAWAWGWKRTAGWLVVVSLFGIWALLERRSDDDDRTAAGRFLVRLGRRASGATAALLAGGLVFEAFLHVMRILFNCARCAG
jgi:hypothetical protein